MKNRAESLARNNFFGMRLKTAPVILTNITPLLFAKDATTNQSLCSVEQQTDTEQELLSPAGEMEKEEEQTRVLLKAG